MQKSNSKFAVLPVMFGFFIMGFVDIVGVATSYVKADFAGMDDKVSGLISLPCFLWFLILSIPTGMLMNRIGRKKTVVVSFAITALAMLIPVLKYDFAFVLVAFAMLGIGNTMLQVALNPLVTNVVSAEKLTGTITLGQFIKAMSSFLGPILAAMFAGSVWGKNRIIVRFLERIKPTRLTRARHELAVKNLLAENLIKTTPPRKAPTVLARK